MKRLKKPQSITPAFLSVVVMPNGEVICLGQTIGWWKTFKQQLFVPNAIPDLDPSEIDEIVAGPLA